MKEKEGKDQLRILLGLDQDEIERHLVIPLDMMSKILLHLLTNETAVLNAALKKLGIDGDFFRRVIVESGRLARANRRYRGTVNRKTIFKNGDMH